MRALQMAVAVRGGGVAGVRFHTDQGSEYTAGLFRAACARMGVVQSMGRAGSALDNAAAESLFSSMEFEVLRAGPFASRAEARTAVAAWIDDFNHVRLHSADGLRPPVEFERLDSAVQQRIRAASAAKKEARRARRAAARPGRECAAQGTGPSAPASRVAAAIAVRRPVAVFDPGASTAPWGRRAGRPGPAPESARRTSKILKAQDH
ncbi:hypothetical protein GCM10010466_68330 [Planomonospora alba]|uniref:Integrase catalytic domain-containing protein n=1 Tax=Planomonospora alba TaxID=161354 RepID=A0ABP6P6P4_9ACTN